MGDLNPNASNPLGMEPHFYRSQTVPLDGSRIAVATRIRPGAASIDAVHKRLASVDAAPGLGIEIVSTLQPATSLTEFVPAGTITLDPLLSWVDQGGAAPAAADVDEPYNPAEYVRNANATSKGVPIRIRADGTSPGTGGLASQRILSIVGGAVMFLRDIDDTARTVDTRFFLRLNGVNYYGPTQEVRRGKWRRKEELARWHFNPDRDTTLGVLNMPWTLERADDIIDTGDADGIGFELSGRVASAGFRLSSFFIRVHHCTENRIACYYTDDAPRPGWVQYDLRGPDSSGGAFGAVGSESADTYYWLVVSCPYAQTGERATTQLVRQVGATLSDAASQNDREHRRAYRLTLSGPAGVPDDSRADDGAVDAPDEMLGFLLDDGGSIISQSQPYEEADELRVDNQADALFMQQFTTVGAINVAAIRIPVRWWEDTRPDAPLIVKLRTTAGAGAPPQGSLVATAMLDPADIESLIDYQDVQLRFDVTAALGAATAYHITVESDATETQGWAVPRDDTRSDHIGTATTTAEIQGATIGGTTDSYLADGTADDRYDLPACLIAPPSGPDALAATALGAAE